MGSVAESTTGACTGAEAAADASRSALMVDPERLSFEDVFPKRGDVWYSMRRYYVDEFYTRRVAALPRGASVADIGGKKARKRGQFDIEREVATRGLHVTYVNLDPESEPDIVADACELPVEDGVFDAVVMAEIVEHLESPASALREACRVLKPGGVLLATAPFMHQVHPDPVDIGRYAPQWWRGVLEGAGFGDIEIEPQGKYFSVLADMLRSLACHTEERQAWPEGLRDPLLGLLRWARDTAHTLDADHPLTRDRFFGSFTTGYGVCAVKQGSVACRTREGTAG